MKWLLGALALVALPAQAAVLISFTGTIDSSSPSPFADDPDHFNVPLQTDTISVNFSISDNYFVDLGNGSAIAGVYHDPAGSMTLSAPPFSWDKRTDIFDGANILFNSFDFCSGPGQPDCQRPQVLISTPALLFQDGAITAFQLAAEPGVGLPLAPFISSQTDMFTITQGFYGGALYAGPDYTGHWNLDSAVITSIIPEPATWLSLILGFGLIGMALRQHGRTRRVPARQAITGVVLADGVT